MPDVFELVIEIDGRKVPAQARRVSDSLTRVQRSAQLANKALAAFGVGIGLASLASLGRKIIEVSSQFEQLRARLKTVTGSAEAAGMAFRQISDFATSTPFEIQKITEAYIGLKARGFEPTMEAMRDLGNLAAAQGQDITHAMLAVTQAAFGEADMMKAYGVQMKFQGDKVALTYNNVTQTVERNSQKIFEALRKIASENFGSAMADQMNTWKGATSNLNDAWEQFLDALNTGGGVLDSLTPIIKALTFLLEKMTAGARNWRAAWILLFADLKVMVVRFWEAIREPLSLLARRIFPALQLGIERVDRAMSNLAKSALNDTLRGFAALNQETGTGKLPFKPMADAGGEALDVLGKVNSLMAQLERAAARLVRQFEELRVIREVLPTGEALLDQRFGAIQLPMIDVEGSKSQADEVVSFFWTRWRSHLDNGMNYWQGLMETLVDMGFSIPLLNAISGAANILSGAIQRAYFEGFNREDTRRLFEDLGRVAGEAFAGPFGAAVGAIIGDIIGKALSKIGQEATPKGRLTLGPGPGGISGGISGTQGLDALADVFRHIQTLMGQILDIVGDTLTLTRQVQVVIEKGGKIWVNVFDAAGNFIESVGGFASLAEAAEWALLHLLQTAEISGEMKAAYRELIENATDMQELMSQLQFLRGLGGELNRLAGGPRATKQALIDALQQFKALERAILDMGLSAEAAAPLLAEVSKAQEDWMRSMQVGPLRQLADAAERFGIATELSVKARVLEVKLQFLTLKMQLKMLDLWDRYGALWRELFRLAKQEARRAGRGAMAGFQHGSGGFQNFFGGTPVILHGREQVSTMGEGRSIAHMVAAAIRRESSSGVSDKLIAEVRMLGDKQDRLATALRRQSAELAAAAIEARARRVA